jgi:hypothetical protein
MTFVPILSHNPPIGIGASKKLWSSQQFNQDGVYPKANPDAICTYETDPATGKLFYVDGIMEGSSFAINTGNTFFPEGVVVPIPPPFPTATHLNTEQGLWALGKFSIGSFLRYETYTGTQNGGGQDSYNHNYAPPAAPGLRVIIDNRVYDVELVEEGPWSYYTTSTGPGNNQDGWDIYTSMQASYQVKLVGAPDLSGILSINKLVFFTNEVAP